MSLPEAVSSVFKNYANFSGRARRSEFWFFMLFNMIVNLCLGTVMIPFIRFYSFAVLIPLYSLAVLIPGLAVAVRRLHDTNKSGFWLFLALVPLVGEILLIVWLAEDSSPAPNVYGYSPKYMNRPGYVGRPPREVTLGVRCLSGPLQGHTYPVGKSGVIIGRSADCAIRLPDGTPGVSARHCAIQYRGDMPMITDLGSTYGTYISDGRKLPSQYPHPAHVGMRFYLGRGDIQFELVMI